MTERTGSDISPLAVSTSRNPRGWFQVAWADTIAAGEVKTLHYFGEELVAFRTKSGKLSILDAYCQHLGAHLGVGGKVEGEEGFADAGASLEDGEFAAQDTLIPEPVESLCLDV